MAKGFTVKAKNPKPKKAAAAPQYDYAKAKEMIKGKKTGIIACGTNIDIKDFHNLIS